MQRLTTHISHVAILIHGYSTFIIIFELPLLPEKHRLTCSYIIFFFLGELSAMEQDEEHGPILRGYPRNPYNDVICNDTIAASGVFTAKELRKLSKGEIGEERRETFF